MVLGGSGDLASIELGKVARPSCAEKSLADSQIVALPVLPHLLLQASTGLCTGGKHKSYVNNLGKKALASTWRVTAFVVKSSVLVVISAEVPSRAIISAFSIALLNAWAAGQWVGNIPPACKHTSNSTPTNTTNYSRKLFGQRPAPRPPPSSRQRCRLLSEAGNGAIMAAWIQLVLHDVMLE